MALVLNYATHCPILSKLSPKLSHAVRNRLSSLLRMPLFPRLQVSTAKLSSFTTSELRNINGLTSIPSLHPHILRPKITCQSQCRAQTSSERRDQTEICLKISTYPDGWDEFLETISAKNNMPIVKSSAQFKTSSVRNHRTNNSQRCR